MIRLALCTQGIVPLQTALGRLSCVSIAHLPVQLALAVQHSLSLQAFSVLNHRVNRCSQVPAWSSACKERALCLGNSQQL